MYYEKKISVNLQIINIHTYTYMYIHKYILMKKQLLFIYAKFKKLSLEIIYDIVHNKKKSIL